MHTADKCRIIKIVEDWYKDRPIVQWNRIQSLEINQYTYGQLIFNKGAKTIQWRKNSLFNSGAGTTGYLHAKNEFGPLPHTIKFNSKWIKDLNVRAKTF